MFSWGSKPVIIPSFGPYCGLFGAFKIPGLLSKIDKIAAGAARRRLTRLSLWRKDLCVNAAPR